jgi:predicted dehydrogenase
MTGSVRLGVVGTSWWADAMYLPALTRHPLADVRAVVGSRIDRTREFAARWGVPAAYDSLETMLARESLDGVVIIAPNRHHHPMTMAALERRLHVLCEKPLAMDVAQASQMAEAASRAGVVTMVPFTYRFMPLSRYVKELVDGGWIGTPYHLNLRYYAGYGRRGDYMWRFDLGEAGGGTSADLGSHWADIARWLFGEVAAVTAVLGRAVARAPRPDGAAFEPGDDSGMILLEFANGARGSIHVSSVAWEPSPFGQLHQWEIHGSAGTLHATCDWDRVQRLEGCRDGEPAIRRLPIPDRLFAGLRRDTVEHTYKDTFRETDAMARGFVSAIAAGTPASPDFGDGLAVQRILDAMRISARDGRRVPLAEIE